MDEQRVRDLLTREGTPFAQACLMMLDEGKDINTAAAAVGMDMFALMRQWHEFADVHGIVADDGSRACIHVLSDAYRDAHTASDLGIEVARLAVALAGTASPETRIHCPGETGGSPWVRMKVDDPRLQAYFRVMDATLGSWGGNNAYASCAQAVCGVLACTVDPDIAPWRSAGGASDNQDVVREWLEANPRLYRSLGRVSSEGQLLPGDILYMKGHIVIYVGERLCQEKWPRSDGNVFEAAFHAGFYPGIDHYDTFEAHPQFGPMWGYRPVARRKSPRFPFIDYRSLL